MEVSPKDATYALLGVHGPNVGVVCWHDNELEAWRHAKQINDSGGNVKVVPVVDGKLTAKYEAEKSELFREKYSRLNF